MHSCMLLTHTMAIHNKYADAVAAADAGPAFAGPLIIVLQLINVVFALIDFTNSLKIIRNFPPKKNRLRIYVWTQFCLPEGDTYLGLF